MFDWSDVRVFLTVQRGGSFSTAARELRMDQTTVGRRIAVLEASLGVKLFRRGRDGLTLTSAGQAVVEHASRMEQDALALDRAVRGQDTAVGGVVRVTTLESFGARFLAPRLGPLRAKHPSLAIDVHTENRSLNLSRREADLAVRFARPVQDGLVARKIGAVAYALYGAPAYVEARGGKRSARDLASHDLLGFDDDLSFIPEAVWLSQNAGAARVVRSNSVAVLEAGAVAGLGLAVLPCFIADGRADLERVVSAVVMRDLWLVVHAELRGVPRVRAVTDFIAQIVREGEGLLLGATPR